MAFSKTLKTYYWFTKPWIVYSNTITAMAGFFLASKGQLDFVLFMSMLVGIMLVIAAACVFNNYLDQGIDQKMDRTKKRALITGKISNRAALIFGSGLGSIGFLVLITLTNTVAASAALFLFVLYVAVYTPAKTRTHHSTELGSLVGAAPPVVGYTAATGNLDMTAILLFLVLLFWQMPHFYALSIYKLKDYQKADIPLWPAKFGIKSTKNQILLYLVGFIVATMALTLYGVTGMVYTLVMLLACAWWLNKALKGKSTKDNEKWARGVFKASVRVLLIWCLMISVEAWLP